MGRRHSEGHITGLRNTRMEMTSRRQRRKEASSEGGQAPEEGCRAIDVMGNYSNTGLGFSSAVAERKMYI